MATRSITQTGRRAAADANASPEAVAAAKEKEALETGIEAYIYDYPLVTMEFTRRVSTNVEKPEGSKAPMGQFARLREYPSAEFKTVTAPNSDTLYTIAWFDVSKEPWVVSLPDMKGRYALFPMLDGWTTVFQVPGKRTTGTKAQTYTITGPGWKGTLQAGATGYKSSTSRGESLAASTAPVRRRTTRRCMPFRTSSSWSRSAPTEGPTRRPWARWIRAWT